MEPAEHRGGQPPPSSLIDTLMPQPIWAFVAPIPCDSREEAESMGIAAAEDTIRESPPSSGSGGGGRPAPHPLRSVPVRRRTRSVRDGFAKKPGWWRLAFVPASMQAVGVEHLPVRSDVARTAQGHLASREVILPERASGGHVGTRLGDWRWRWGWAPAARRDDPVSRVRVRFAGPAARLVLSSVSPVRA